MSHMASLAMSGALKFHSVLSILMSFPGLVTPAHQVSKYKVLQEIGIRKLQNGKPAKLQEAQFMERKKSRQPEEM